MFNFVNFNGNSAYNINVGSLTAFDSFNWGIGTTLYNITIENGGSMYEFFIGDNNNINNIYIGQGSSINQICLANNDNGYLQFHNITLGKSYTGMGSDLSIYNLTLHRRSKFFNILMEGNGSDNGPSNINNLLLGIDSSVYDIKLSKGSTFNYADILSGSSIYNITLAQYSYLSEGTVSIYSSINNINLGVNSYIDGFNIIGSSGISYIELGMNSNIQNLYLTSPYSSFQTISLGVGSYISNIHFNDSNSNFENITLGLGSEINNIYFNNNCRLNRITLGNNSNISNLHLNYNENYIEKLNLNTNSSIYDITFNGNYSGIDNLELGIYSGLGSLTFGHDAYLSSVQIGVDAGIHNMEFKNNSEIYDLTIGEDCYLSNLIFSGYQYNKIIDKNNNNFPAEFDVNSVSTIELNSISYAGEVTLTSRVTTLTYTSLSGTFVVGDMITDSTTNATAVIINDNGSNSMVIKILDKTKSFNNGDSISTGTAGALVDTYTIPQSNVIINTINNFDDKWPVKFLVEDGLTVTFNGTPVSNVTNGVITMPTPTFTAVGDNQDYFVIKHKTNTAQNIIYCQQIDAQNYL